MLKHVDKVLCINLVLQGSFLLGKVVMSFGQCDE